MGRAGGWLLRAVCLVSTLLEYGAVRVTMRHPNLEVVQGDPVTLPCSFFTMIPLSRLNIIWTLAPFSDPDFPTQVIVFDHGQVIENPSLTGRVGFPGIPWSADIILNNTHISDAGTYRCMVSNPPETGDPGIGELALNVLAPPSLPLCLWDGVTDTGGSVALSCMVAEGVPTPEMRWDKLEPEEISLPINMDGDLSGSVQIVNISSQNSGLYRCSVTNLLGTQNCYVNLSIYSRESLPGPHGFQFSLTLLPPPPPPILVKRVRVTVTVLEVLCLESEYGAPSRQLQPAPQGSSRGCC
uniref:Zgc:165604 n=1 Tax=Hucho hucho TaxID=62062 RepID=A0A4W5MHE6_9TELE